jgi:hypothetical protein
MLDIYSTSGSTTHLTIQPRNTGIWLPTEGFLQQPKKSRSQQIEKARHINRLTNLAGFFAHQRTKVFAAWYLLQ